MARSSEKECLYDVLGLEKNCTPAEIRGAYKSLAMKWHPDKCTHAEPDFAKQKFQLINEAYTVLNDENMRKRYDAGARDFDEEELDTEDLMAELAMMMMMSGMMGGGPGLGNLFSGPQVERAFPFPFYVDEDSDEDEDDDEEEEPDVEEIVLAFMEKNITRVKNKYVCDLDGAIFGKHSLMESHFLEAHAEEALESAMEDDDDDMDDLQNIFRVLMGEHRAAGMSRAGNARGVQTRSTNFRAGSHTGRRGPQAAGPSHSRRRGGQAPKRSENGGSSERPFYQGNSAGASASGAKADGFSDPFVSTFAAQEARSPTAGGWRNQEYRFFSAGNATQPPSDPKKTAKNRAKKQKRKEKRAAAAACKG